jgi:hypothetical protein
MSVFLLLSLDTFIKNMRAWNFKDELYFYNIMPMRMIFSYGKAKIIHPYHDYLFNNYFKLIWIYPNTKPINFYPTICETLNFRRYDASGVTIIDIYFSKFIINS